MSPMSPLRYAILHHQLPDGSHFDLMFETLPGSSLATWRSPQWPIEQPTIVTRIKDHRRIFLEYEGELSESRGYIVRVAGGTCDLSIGENSVWTIRLLSGVSPQAFSLSLVAADQWNFTPRS